MVLLNALPNAVRSVVEEISEFSNEMRVTFKSGQKTQANYDAVLATLQQLTNQGTIQHACQLVAV